MQEQGIVGLGAINEPAHGSNDVLLGWVHDGVWLVIRQEDHVLPLVAIPLNKKVGQVVHVVYAAPEFALLAEVVDANEESLALTGTVRVLEGVSFRGTMTELLGRRGWRRSGPGAMSGVPGLVERIAICVEAGRRGMSRRRRLAVGLASVAAAAATVSGTGRRRLVTVAARRWWRGRTVVAAAALVLLIGTAASMMVLRAVVALAGVAAAVVRHDGA